MFFFFFQAEDGIRDTSVTGVQTCALPISDLMSKFREQAERFGAEFVTADVEEVDFSGTPLRVRVSGRDELAKAVIVGTEIGRASCRERVEIAGVGGSVKHEWRLGRGVSDR